MNDIIKNNDLPANEHYYESDPEQALIDHLPTEEELKRELNIDDFQEFNL